MSELAELPATAPAPSDEALRAADKLRRAVGDLQRRLRLLRANHGVSASKLIILGRLLRAGGPLTASDLARMERLQPQSLTRTIAELDEAGLIVRRPDEADKRQVMIGLTPAGRDVLVQDARAQTAWLAAEMASFLTETDRGVLVVATAVMERLAEANRR